MDTRRLIFVYNADSGLFNTLSDIAHKLLSPTTYPCQLCAITHTPFAMRGEWRRFLAGLDVECAFWHRDEQTNHYPQLRVVLPAVLCETANDVVVCLDASDLAGCESMDDLKRLIETRCFAPGELPLPR